MTKMRITHKTLGTFAVAFLGLGSVPAYFGSMFYAISLWMIGFGLMNIHVFILSHERKI
jgi:hypothetical protein